MASLSSHPKSSALQLVLFHQEHHLSLCLRSLVLKIIKHALKKERADLTVPALFSIRSGKLHVLSGLTTWWRVSGLCSDSRVRCKSVSMCRAYIVNFTVSVANSVLHCQASAHFGGSDFAACFTQMYPLRAGPTPLLAGVRLKGEGCWGARKPAVMGFIFP